MNWLDIDWAHIFAPETPILEIFIRGTVIYLGLFVLLRVVLNRQSGTVGITDLLVVVLLADAAQNGLADDYHSVTDGLFLVVTILFWSYLLDWLGYHVPAFERIVRPPPLQLVRNGQKMRRNMRRELITDEELMSQLREQGVDELSKVKEVFMEGDGRFSIVLFEEQRSQNSSAPDRVV